MTRDPHLGDGVSNCTGNKGEGTLAEERREEGKGREEKRRKKREVTN